MCDGKVHNFIKIKARWHPQTNLGWLFLLIVICGSTFLRAQSHFQPVAPTGKPYTIVITGASLNTQPVLNGTEFGVFDDALCVGAAVLQDTFPVIVTAWEGSPDFGQAGFVSGHSILFKMYTQNPLGAWFEGFAGTIYAIGNGNFGYGAYSAVELITTTVTNNDQNSLPDKFQWRAFPNPFNNQMTFIFEGVLAGNELSLRIYTLTGTPIFEKVFHPAIRFFHWDGRDTNGCNVPSGNYLVVVENGRLVQKGVITIQK